jgi:hypothetical protein
VLDTGDLGVFGWVGVGVEPGMGLGAGESMEGRGRPGLSSGEGEGEGDEGFAPGERRRKAWKELMGVSPASRWARAGLWTQLRDQAHPAPSSNEKRPEAWSSNRASSSLTRPWLSPSTSLTGVAPNPHPPMLHNVKKTNGRSKQRSLEQGGFMCVSPLPPPLLLRSFLYRRWSEARQSWRRSFPARSGMHISTSRHTAGEATLSEVREEDTQGRFIPLFNPLLLGYP